MTHAAISANSLNQHKLKMKTAILVMVLTAAGSMAQGIEVSISSDSAEYNQRYSTGRDRYITITTAFKNNTTQSVYLKTDPQFDLAYLREGFGWPHCFRIYEYDKQDDSTFTDYKFHRYESFVKIEPGEVVISKGYYSIDWLCRSAPPMGIWEFNITYHAVLTADDNYYLVNSRYTDFTSKEFVNAWTGELRSNSIKVTIN